LPVELKSKFLAKLIYKYPLGVGWPMHALSVVTHSGHINGSWHSLRVFQKLTGCINRVNLTRRNWFGVTLSFRSPCGGTIKSKA